MKTDKRWKVFVSWRDKENKIEYTRALMVEEFVEINDIIEREFSWCDFPIINVTLEYQR